MTEPARESQETRGSAGSAPRRAVGVGAHGTRERILATAGRLMAERGPDAVSLREITRAAGQRNTGALQYHFGDREGLLRALVDRHVPPVAERRHALLDLFEDKRALVLRDVATALVSPLLAELRTPEGAAFLQVASYLINSAETELRPDSAREALVFDASGSFTRWAQLAAPLMPEGTTGAPLHRRFSAIRFTHVELGRRAGMAPGESAGLFGSQLTDLVSALLGAPMSDETRGRLAARDSPTGPRSRHSGSRE